MLTKLKIEEIYRGCTWVALYIEEDQMKLIAQRLQDSPKFRWVEDWSTDEGEDRFVSVSATHKRCDWLACVGHDEVSGQPYVAAKGEFTFGTEDDLDHTIAATTPSSGDIAEISAVIRDLLELAK